MSDYCNKLGAYCWNEHCDVCRARHGIPSVTVAELHARLGLEADAMQRCAEAAGQPTSGYIGRQPERTPLADLAALVMGRFTPDLVQADVVLAGQKADA